MIQRTAATSSFIPAPSCCRMMVLVLLLLSANTAPTAAATTPASEKRKNRLRSRRVADALDELNLGYASLYLPTAGSNTTTTTNGVVSCHRTFSEVEQGGGGVGWHGKCDDGYDANFVQQQQQQRPDDGAVGVAALPHLQTFGTYRTSTKICRVGPDATGWSTVECTDENEFELEEEADLEEALDDDETHDRKLADLNVTFAMSHVSLDQLAGRRRLYDDSGSTIDVLVVWTTMAECLNSKLEDKCTLTTQTESNMRGLIDLAMVETNVAFALSNIKTKLRLVHAYRDGSYQEPTPTSAAPNVWTTMLEHLTQVTDGQLDGVHAVRTRYGADVVHMIAGSAGSCGAAHVGPRKNRVFSLSRNSCATGYYSFGHEIAHSLGAHHDRPSMARCGKQDSSYNFGYRDPEAKFRTILSYGCQVDQCDNLPKNGCERIQRFSNAVTTYDGKPLGDASNDNARTINEASPIVAAYYPAMDCIADHECDDQDGGTVDTCNVQQRVCVFTPASATSSTSPPPPSGGTAPSPTSSSSTPPPPPPTASPPVSPASSNDKAAMMEAVVVVAVNATVWHTVHLRHTDYQNPVVACSVRYHLAKPVMVPVVVRVTAVTRKSFKVLVQNPSNKKDVISRQVHCLVVEAGVWTLPDGRKIEARRGIMSARADGRDAWVVPQKQPYQHTYSHDPVVLGQVMSYNDHKWSTFWTCGKNRWVAPDATHLAVGLQVGEDRKREQRKSEEIGYIVMERGRTSTASSSTTTSGSAVVGTVVVESDRCAVTPAGYESGQSWTCPFRTAAAGTAAAGTGNNADNDDEKPTIVVATIVGQVGMAGADGSWAVLTAGATIGGGFGVAVDEDQCLEPERVHVAEQVNYVAVLASSAAVVAPVRLTKVV